MPRKAKWPPPVHRHKSGQARVRIGGRDVYLGPFGSKEADEALARIILAGPGEAPIKRKKKDQPLTVAEALECYRSHAEAHYRHQDGRSTSEMGYVNTAIGVVLDATPDATYANDFRGKALKQVRDRMVAKGWARSNVNHHVNVVKRIWKWLASEELISAECYGSVKAVEALKAGRTTAPESKKVTPANLAHVEAALPYLTPHLQAAVRLQLYTACRPGEALGFDPAHVERTGSVWLWRPLQHKTQHHGKDRVILVGPRAQAVLLPLLASHKGGPLFSPRTSEALRLAARRAGAKTPRHTPLLRGRHRMTLNRTFAVGAYSKAVRRACAWAEVPCWSPHQLRHAAATMLTAEFGIETARVILGHSHIRVSELYAEVDLGKAVAAIEKVG